MGKVSAKAAKRLEIMKIGATVFKEVGYESATVDEIAKRANMDRATFYYYFKGKQELFREMVNLATANNVANAERIAALKEPPEVKLRKLVEALFDSYQQHYPYLYVYLERDISRLTFDQSEWSATIIAMNARFNQAAVSIVREGRETGAFIFSVSDKVIAAGVLGMCNWSHSWFNPDGALSAAEIGRAFADMVIEGICPSARKPLN